jgi:hypothetical protein
VPGDDEAKPAPLVADTISLCLNITACSRGEGMGTSYRINVALWQVPTMVVNGGRDEAEQRLGTNVTGTMTIDERMDILEQRVAKAVTYFHGQPANQGARSLTVFAAPEYLFAKDEAEHFITHHEKDRLLAKLAGLSKRFPSVVLFPGTIAWKKPAIRSGMFAAFRPDRGKRAHQRRTALATEVSDKNRFDQHRASGNQYYLAENTCFVMHAGKTVLKYHKRNNGGETNRASDGDDVFWVPGPRDSLFSVDGLDFGLQICAEMGSDLSRVVDVQVAIASSHPIVKAKARLHPQGFYCYADAIKPPEVYQADNAGGIGAPIRANMKRVGGSVMGKTEATARAKDIGKYGEGTAEFAEQITKLRGRVRYYVLDYDKA